MFQPTIILVFAVLVTVAQSYPVLEENDEGQLYYLITAPKIRHRRQTTVDIHKSGGATSATLGHTGNIFENDKHQVTGNGFVSKSFPGPTTIGGGVGYEHIPSGSNVNLRAANTRGFGTNVGVNGAANLWRNGNSNLDATGGWSRSYTRFGASRPDYNVGLRFTHRF